MTKRILTLLISAMLAVFVCSAVFAQATATSSAEITDTIVGRNTPGPYTLTWKDFEEKSIKIIVTGRTLRKNKDYKVSVSDGMLSFDSVLVNDAIARVTYKLVQGKSTKTTRAAQTPLSLSLLQNPNAALNFTGLYATDEKGNATAVVGLDTKRNWGASSFASSFNLSQGKEGDSTSTMDRASMAFGGSTALGALKLAGSYSNVGRAFAGASSYGQTLGEQITNLSMAFNPEGGKLQATGSYKEMLLDAGDKKGAYTLENIQQATLAATSSTNLYFNRTETASREKAGAQMISKDETAIKLDQSLGKLGGATMSMTDSTTVDKNNLKTEITSNDYALNTTLGGLGMANVNITDRQTTVGGVLTDLQQKDYSFATKFADNISARMTMQDKQTTIAGNLYDYKQRQLALGGNFAGGAMGFTSTDVSRSDNGIEDNIRTNVMTYARALGSKMDFASSITKKQSDLRGRDDTMSFGLTNRFRENFGVTLAHNIINSDVDGDTTSNTLKIDTMKFDKLAMTGSLTESENTLTGKSTTQALDLTTNPLKFMSLSTKYSSTQNEIEGLTDKTAVTLALNPSDKVQISGTVADKTDKNVPTLSRALNLASTPIKHTQVNAFAGQSGTGSLITNRHGASLAFAPRERLSFSAGFVNELTGSSLLTINDYAATFGLSKYLTLSGNYIDRNLNTGSAYDSANMSMTLNPFKFLAFTGTYTLNPNDKKGVLQNYEANTLGMTARLGSLSLTGAYTSKDHYLTGTFIDETKLGLAMPVFGSGQLETNLRMAKNFASNQDLCRAYSLSYRQKFSDDFSLSLGGTYTRYIQNQMRMPERDDLQANLSFDIKF